MNRWIDKALILIPLLIDNVASKRLKVNGHLRVATYNNPLAGIKSLPNGNTGLMERELLGWLSSDLNFTYDIVVPRDVYQLGILKSNGSWTGGLGLLKRDEADLSISFGPRNLQRFQQFDLTSSIITDNIGIMVPYPTFGINPSGFANIYTPLTWTVIILSTLAVVSSIWLIARHFKPYDKFDYCTLSLYVLGVVLGQGGWLRSYSIAFHVIFGLWLLMLVVIVNAYQGTLVSRLSAPYINYLAKSLEEVATDGMISPFTLKESATHSEFKDSLLPTFKAINSRFEASPELLLNGTANAVETILNKTDSVMIISDIILNDEIRRDYEKTGSCRALVLKNKVLVRRNGLFLAKNSEWTRAIDNYVLLLRQHGLGQYLEEKYKTYEKGKCSIDDQQVRTQNYNGPLKFHQMKGALYVLLAIGIFLSCIVFSAEHFAAMYYQHKRTRA